jgi:hypothetical protein
MLGISKNGMPVTVSVLFSKMPCKILRSVSLPPNALKKSWRFLQVFIMYLSH